MSESITVSSENKQVLDLLKKPGETYDDVIKMLLEEHQEETEACERWTKRATEAWEEYDRGETLTEAEIMKKYGVI